MKWDSFYENFWGWSDAAQIKIAQMQTDFGASDEVAEIGMAFFYEKIASRFIGRAKEKGVDFTPEQIVELVDYVDEETLAKLIISTKAYFTAEQIEILDGYVDEDRIAGIRTDIPSDTDELPQHQNSKLSK